MKRNILICIITVGALNGCIESDRVAAPDKSTMRIDTCEGMAKYLRKQNLPALVSVERWQNEYGPGLRLITAHYEVLTTLLEPLMLSEVPGFLESAYRGYQRQLPEPIDTKNRFVVYLFAERKQWEDFTRGFTGSLAPLYCKPEIRAYVLKGACVSYNSGRESTFSNLGHEGWHQFNSRHFKFRLPTWLDEGVAMLFEVNREQNGLFYFEVDKNVQRLGVLKKALAGNRMIPLRELVALNPAEMLNDDDHIGVAAFYGQSYALVRFLREEGYGKRLADYHRLLIGGLTGSWPLSQENRMIAADRNIPLTVRWNRTVGPQLFSRYIDSDFDGIEKEYLAFCRKILYNVKLKK